MKKVPPVNQLQSATFAAVGGISSHYFPISFYKKRVDIDKVQILDVFYRRNFQNFG